MARKYLVSIDLSKNELQNARIQNLASAPSSPVSGQIYYNTTDNTMYFYNGTAFVPAGGIASGVLASRPLATAVASGTFYYATDNFLIYYSNGAAWQQVNNFGSGQSTALTIAGTSTDGSSTNFARADHIHSGPGFAASTDTTTYGLTKSNGSSTTVSRSDHTHGTPSLSSNAATNLSTTTAANGTGTAPAKDDHVHGFAPSGFALSAFGAPISAVAFNSQRITGLADPISAQDAATKGYVDSTAQGLDVKQSVRVATSVAGTLSTSFANAQVVDGVTLVTGDRILIKNQVTGSENGIYTVNSTGAPTRATDADISAEVTAGLFVFIAEGTNNADTGYVLTTNDTITLGTTSLTFTQFSGTGSFTAGVGLNLTGTSFSVDVTPDAGSPSLINTGGAVQVKTDTAKGLSVTTNGLGINNGTGLAFSSGALAIDTASGYGVRKLSFSIGDGTSTSIVVNHALGTRDTTVQIYDNASPYANIEADTEHTDTNNITVKFAVAPTSSQYRVVIVG